MRLKATKTAKIADLQTNLFVRDALDQNHVMYLAEMIENGVEMNDLIEATEIDNALNVVDGRHRKEAYELNRVTEVRVKILEFDDEAEMIAYAYRANTGGSKPPTAADTEHTVKLLLERKESMKRIGELLGLPPSMARRYANEVKSRMNRAKLSHAVDLVVSGNLTAAKAAEQCEVDFEKLKEALSGNRKNRKEGLKDLHRSLSTLYNGLGKKNAALAKKFMDQFEDGDVTEGQVRDVFAHVEDLQKKAVRAFSDWKKRFEARVAAKKAGGKAVKIA